MVTLRTLKIHMKSIAGCTITYRSVSFFVVFKLNKKLFV